MSPLIACCTVAWVSLPPPSSSTKGCSSHPVTWKVAFAVVMASVLCLIHTYVEVLKNVDLGVHNPRRWGHARAATQPVRRVAGRPREFRPRARRRAGLRAGRGPRGGADLGRGAGPPATARHHRRRALERRLTQHKSRPREGGSWLVSCSGRADRI